MTHLLVTHHAPDLDAIASLWLLKRFESQRFADAKVAFVSPGEKISPTTLQELGFDQAQVIYADTGLGEFDHHQPDRANQHICAASLVFDHLIQIHPELTQDKALRYLVDFVTEIDHFGEVNWPEAGHSRYLFMLPEIIHGLEHLELHNDDSQLNFGFTCLDSCYQNLKNHFKAQEILQKKSQVFKVGDISGVAVETRNDEIIKMAQKSGYDLVVRKDTRDGHIRIKARPDSGINLEKVYQAIIKHDLTGTWFYHAGGKMLLNGSVKNHNQIPSPLSLNQLIKIIKENLL